MRRIRILSALSALALGLGAIATAGAAEKPVALIIAQGGLGDQSYNDLAYSGFKKALAEDKLEGKAVESKDVVAQAADILRRASDAGFGLIVDLEYSHGDALQAVAKDYPGTDYVILNQVEAGGERRLSAVPGAGRILSRRRARDDGRDGYQDQGHERQADDRRHRRHQVGRHRQVHRRLYPGGARHRSARRKSRSPIPTISAIRRSACRWRRRCSTRAPTSSTRWRAAPGLGVIQAAKEAGRFAIGVDTDQDGIAPGSVLTSMVKRTDVAVETVMKDYADGKFPGGQTVTLGLAQDGVGLSPMKYTRDMIPAATLAKVEDLKKKILSGEIKVWNVVDQGYPDFFK